MSALRHWNQTTSPGWGSVRGSLFMPALCARPVAYSETMLCTLNENGGIDMAGEGAGTMVIQRDMFRDKHRSFWESVVALIFHLLGTACIFCALVVIAWGVSCLLSMLNAAHPFPAEIWEIFTKIEAWLIYADGILCSIVLLAGAWRFCQDLMEVRSL